MTAKEMNDLLDDKELKQLYSRVQTLWACGMNYAMLEAGTFTVCSQQKSDLEKLHRPPEARIIDLRHEIDRGAEL